MPFIEECEVKRGQDGKANDDDEQDQIRDESTIVLWRFGRGVEMRAQDVPSALADEKEGSCAFSLRVARRVLRGPRIDQWRNARIKGDDVVGKQEDSVVRSIVFNSHEDGTANYWGNTPTRTVSRRWLSEWFSRLGELTKG